MTDLAKYRERLATEVMGLSRNDEKEFWIRYHDNGMDTFACLYGAWRPDKDVAQAIQCLEALRTKYLSTVEQDWNNKWCSSILLITAPEEARITAWARADTPAAAIVTAIVKAKGWDSEPGAGG